MKKYDVKTKIGIILMLISISGLFGFIYEFIFYYFNGGMKEFYYRGGNFLPWIDIYALGALIIFFLTRNTKSKLKVFLISLISCGVLEYLAGYLIYIFQNGARYWDYNTEILNFGNINGFICLRSVLFFGLSGVILMYIIMPFIYKLADKKHFIIYSYIIGIIVLIDSLYNLIVVRVLPVKSASEIYKSIGVKYVKFPKYK